MTICLQNFCSEEGSLLGRSSRSATRFADLSQAYRVADKSCYTHLGTTIDLDLPPAISSIIVPWWMIRWWNCDRESHRGCPRRPLVPMAFLLFSSIRPRNIPKNPFWGPKKHTFGVRGKETCSRAQVAGKERVASFSNLFVAC